MLATAPPIPPKPFEISQYDYVPDVSFPGATSSISSLSLTGQGEESGGSQSVEHVTNLMAMGFKRPQAIQALEMFDYDLARASNYLLDYES